MARTCAAETTLALRSIGKKGVAQLLRTSFKVRTCALPSACNGLRKGGCARPAQHLRKRLRSPKASPMLTLREQFKRASRAISKYPARSACGCLFIAITPNVSLLIEPALELFNGVEDAGVLPACAAVRARGSRFRKEAAINKRSLVC